ncbi:MFS transporter [Spelaeicoccus albus]|uniref:MFS family permease n=1 Tax=Spelaeicoccus albus TaxID=1280376 RepID=A0A7Z0D4Q4_9MICO|nr:MFS transporter [Spelaeicoccus albus]NYI68852.1 MFS family permease [Spelaeicoccus albus]
MTEQSTHGAPTSLADPRVRTTVVVMFALDFLTAFELFAVTTAMPTMARELHGIELYGLAFAAPLTMSIFALTVGGVWNDRSGPGVPLQVGIVVFSAGLLSVGFSPNMWVVVAGRSLQGLGTGLVAVSLYVVVGRLFPGELQPKLFAVLSAAWVLPGLVGPALAGFVTATVGWRWIFLAVPVLALAGLFALRPSVGRLRAAVDGPRSAVGRKPLWAVGAAAGVFLFSRGGERADAWWPVELAVAACIVIVTVPRLMPAGVWRAVRGIPSVVAMRGLIAAAFGIAEVFIPLLLTDARGFGPAMAGLALSIGSVAWFCGAWLAGRGKIRVPVRMPVAAAFLTVGIAGALLPVFQPVPVAVGLVFWAMAGTGMGLAYPTLAVLILRYSPQSEHGVNSSALQLSEAIGQSIAFAGTGALFAAILAMSPRLGFIAAFAVAVVIGIAALAVSRRTVVGDV